MISVVIPAYNEEKYIGACLESLKNQTRAPDEVIVVDNNSTDRTAEIAASYGAKVVREQKQGISHARNAGFNAAANPIIARTDADAIVPPDWIECILHNFEQNNIEALCGPVRFYDATLLNIGPRLYLFALKLMTGSETFTGGNMILTKKLWEQVRHSASTDDNKVHEDADLAICVRNAHATIYRDNKLIVSTSARRITKNPVSFFFEYPIRLIKTIRLKRN